VCIRGQVRRVENAGGRCEKGWSPPCHMLNAGLCARGMAGVKLPDIFVVPGEDGGRGGDEFAFMSCSTNREVAVSYIDTKKGLPILFEFDVGSIDRGAPLSFRLFWCFQGSIAALVS